MPTVGTTAAKLAKGGQRLVIQNLGPGNVAFSYSESPSLSAGGDGIKLAVDQAYEFPVPASGDVYAVADAASTDVRVERL